MFACVASWAVRLALFTIFAADAKALNPIQIVGYKLFDSVTGDEFAVRGIDYYPRPNHGDLNQNSLDLFTEEHRHIWERDIPYLQELGVNAVRLYAVDAEQDHDAFMCAMESAGIYVIVALAHDCPTCAVTRDAAPDCYPPELKLQGQRVINAFSKYPNTLAFSAGNEVNHFAPPNQPEWNAPCQKKFIKDMREYLSSCSSLRRVPVGLISADNDREALADYYNCGDGEFETAEWYGLNSYVFCDGKASNYSEALGFHLLAKAFEDLNYSIPVLLTEFGCLSETFPTVDGYPGQRNFLQGQWMLSEPELRGQFQGGFAFEYSMEMENAQTWPFKEFGNQNYGLGYFSPQNCDDINIPCTYHPLPAFDMLKQAYRNGLQASKSLPSLTADTFVVEASRQSRATCPRDFPSLGSFTWEADSTTSVKCPRATRFQCSTWKTLGQQTVSKAATNHMMLVVTACLAFTAILLLVYLIYQQRRMAVPSVLKFQKTDEDSGSSESAGLLSMQNYDARGSVYRAIDSSDDETEMP